MLLQGKKALIFGVANDKSIAYGVAQEFKEQGAQIALNYVGEALLKRVEPIAGEIGADFIFPCDVTSEDEIAAAVDIVREKWGGVDILVHSVAFANREDLQGRFIDTSRDGFKLALDVSAYSLVALSRAFEGLLSDGASIMTMTYLGSERVVRNYNVMGVAKATLEACVRYLAVDLGVKNIRVNALSPGPIRTLAASGITGFKGLLNSIEGKVPLGRNVTQREVGKSAVFLASHLSEAITGEVIYVDCGYSILAI